MALLCGIDEAGYGPTLGPLVIGFTAFASERPLARDALWTLLAPPITRTRTAGGLPVADSKKLHKSAAGDLSPLEATVLSFIACERGGEAPASFRELTRHLTAGATHGSDAYLDSYPWYRGADLPLPHDVHALELAGFVRQLRRRLDEGSVSVAEVRALPIEVDEFNRGLAESDSKGEVNARGMAQFLRRLWQQAESRTAAGVEVWSDRLGGRQRYGPYLYPLFPGCSFDILQQGVERQSYRATGKRDGRSITVHYSTEGDSTSFPTALASMTAKYFRELHMLLFNRWWQSHKPELRPTAGYPEDAKRFLTEIDPIRARQGIDPALLVRRR